MATTDMVTKKKKAVNTRFFIFLNKHISTKLHKTKNTIKPLVLTLIHGVGLPSVTGFAKKLLIK